MSRYRLYPTPDQERMLLDACSHARFVYNLGLEQRKMWRRWQGPVPNMYEQSRQLTEARKENPWLAAGSINIQQQALRDLHRAFEGFFRGTHGYPTWRTRGKNEGVGITGRDVKIKAYSAAWSAAWVPKIGWIKFKLSRPLPELLSYRITRDRAGRWHVKFAAIPAAIPGPGTGDVVGVDRGIKVGAALSTGEMTSPRRLRPKEAERLLRLERRFSRARRGSSRRAVLKLQIARLIARETNRRKDWAEKTSTDLARRFDVIRIERLNTVALKRSARGTVSNPGRNVRQKTALNRLIRSSAWGLLGQRLTDKAPGRVEKVNPAFTSQTCNACKHVARENRKSQAVFLCVNCGHRDNADVNAAKNIRDKRPTAAGLAVAARGDLVHQGRSLKREPHSGAS
jgi:putative transposase